MHLQGTYEEASEWTGGMKWLLPTRDVAGKGADVLLFWRAIQDAFQTESCLLESSQKGLCMLPELRLIGLCFLVGNSTCSAGTSCSKHQFAPFNI